MRKRSKEDQAKKAQGSRMKKIFSFTENVKRVVRSIKKGGVLSYAEVAKRAGAAGASRAVGSIMKKNYDPTIPCHRVIRSDGRLGEYNRGGTRAKAQLLTKEGVRVKDGRVAHA